MNWLLGLTKTQLGQKVIYWLGGKIWSAILAVVSEWLRKLKQTKINEENIKKDKENLESPTATEEEIIEDGENLFNGTRKP